METLIQKTQDIIKQYDETIKIIGKQRTRQGLSPYPDSRNSDKGWMFNQKEMLEQINYMRASRFKAGNLDEYNNRRSYSNITIPAVFNAQKQMDVDTKQYRFIPDTPSDSDLVWFMSRQFKVWSREEQWGKTLDDFMDDFTWYGTVVEKMTKDSIEKVNLNSLIVLQDADSLRSSIEKGHAVTQVHEMNLVEIKTNFPAWDISDLDDTDPDKTIKIYESYAMVPVSEAKEYKGQQVLDGDDEKYTLCMGIIALQSGSRSDDSAVLYSQKVQDIPFIEAHFSKQDGRWLGVGIAELMLEAQVAKNMNVNLRQRNLRWSATKIFQTATSNDVVKNLRLQSKDGDILEVGPQGQLTQVQTHSQHLQDFQMDSADWEDVGRRNTFSFESVTGEAAKSGTPFRLGALQTNNTNLFFDKKRDLFGYFLKEIFFKHQVKLFKKDNSKEHILKIASYETGAERIRSLFIQHKVNEALDSRIDAIIDELEGGFLPSIQLDADAERLLIEDELVQSPYMSFQMPAGVYSDLQYKMELDITGESVDLNQKIESLSTYYQALLQMGNMEQANVVLRQIMFLSGNDAASLSQSTPENKAPKAIEQLQQTEEKLSIPNLTNDAIAPNPATL